MARYIHSCYMTGQTCVYLRSFIHKPSQGAFTIMPFGDDADHFYKHHIAEEISLAEINIKGRIERADTVGRTGYVMCSRICAPIQQSSAAIVDISVPNPNVFYEFGLACALEKRILLLAHEATPQYILTFIRSIGLLAHVEHYSHNNGTSLASAVHKCKPAIGFRRDASTQDRIPVFSNDTKDYLNIARPPQYIPRARKISDLVRGVLRDLQKDPSKVVARCKILADEKGEVAEVIDEAAVRSYLDDLGKNVGPGDDRNAQISTLDSIGSADIVAIDTGPNDFETYFWLGLCHGLQKEVIPFSLTDDYISKADLPFDIRTLWHVSGSSKTMDSVSAQLRQIMIEVTAKVAFNKAVQHRERFWRPIVSKSRLSFYLGTEQSKHLASKQVMGEWDLRAFHVLSSVAQRLNPSLDIRIEKPAFRKHEYPPDEIEKFKTLLQKGIGSSHCIVIGTPDVNPVAEMALCALKRVPAFEGFRPGTRAFSNVEDLPEGRLRDSYVPLKHHDSEYYRPGLTTFYVQINDKEPLRGFLYLDSDGRPAGKHERPYIARENMQPGSTKKLESWDLIGHVVVAPNPFNLDPNTDLKMILVMGVGGPATLGLAHLLAGTPPPDSQWRRRDNDERSAFIRRSEALLASLNQLIAEYNAAEGIAEITVLNDLASHNNEYEDSREIDKIVVPRRVANQDNPKRFVLIP
jgi:hypothetical protein